jgi:Rrf2 family protein
MYFSKSFGYAIRGILYLAMNESDSSNNIQSDELAEQLSIPKYFMAKLLKKLAKAEIIKSIKGPSGGFHLMPGTLDKKLIDILKITDPKDPFDKCILEWKLCNAKQPCPMHHLITKSKNELITVLHSTSISDLIGNKANLRIQLLDKVI